MEFKAMFLTAVGMGGAMVSSLLGGLDHTVLTLFIFMAIDFIAGLICAGVFKASPKSPGGGLTSNACFKGICRKGMIIFIVIIANRLDVEMGSTYIRDGVCVAFIAGELISIIETAGLMGVPVPGIVTKAIDILKDKVADDENNHNM